MTAIHELFEAMVEQGGSDLHLAEAMPPVIRVHGSLERLRGKQPLARKDLIDYLQPLCSEERWKHFALKGELDFAYSLPDGSIRLRANYFLKETGLGAVFRIIPTKIPTLEELGAPDVLKRLAELDRGLVLVTGPTGSGKSTTLAGMLNHINGTFPRRILTIEEPIEFVHGDKRSIVVQREVGTDAKGFGEALVSAARMDFDVIMVGEMRDFETISAAVNAAELGILVFGTLHTNSAPKAVDRIIDVFPAEQHAQVRGQLSESLRGVCAQTLLRRKDGKGRLAAHEVLIQTAAVRTAIREGKTAGLVSAMQSGKALDMCLMDDRIEALLDAGHISKQEAYDKSIDKTRFSAE